MRQFWKVFCLAALLFVCAPVAAQVPKEKIDAAKKALEMGDWLATLDELPPLDRDIDAHRPALLIRAQALSLKARDRCVDRCFEESLKILDDAQADATAAAAPWQLRVEILERKVHTLRERAKMAKTQKEAEVDNFAAGDLEDRAIAIRYKNRAKKK